MNLTPGLIVVVAKVAQQGKGQGWAIDIVFFHKMRLNGAQAVTRQ
ncbi:hypothetical protein UCMB321_2920 [Pseudomonas batumici]|uniref:Uncharacterized protein n=1 Tax=Pseudomonas batumici TaxID=226910 RepID=A0A0C2EC11_9PSED|nr:hypothetical protein UCMB321_2920 [Pseudomonas batumici]